MKIPLAVTLPLTALCHVAAASLLRPPVLPLAVRNPYLSLWMNARDPPYEHWPMFWTGQEIGFSVMAKLSSSQTIFPLLGRPQDALVGPTSGSKPPQQNFTIGYSTFTGFSYDSSTTNLSYVLAGKTEITLVFSSPVTPESLERQSLPGSYLEVVVGASKGMKQEVVDVYVDVNGLFVTNDAGSVIEWDYAKAGLMQTWAVRKREQQLYTERADRAEWGTLYFSGPLDKSVTRASGSSQTLRSGFATNGALTDMTDNDFRPANKQEPVFAFAKRFHGPGSALFTLAHVQDLVTQFSSAKGLVAMQPLWKSYFKNHTSMLQFHYQDYPISYASGKAFADQVEKDASNLIPGTTYADLLALAARQTLGATSFSGTKEQPILWLKEISSNGNFQTVDVIFPAFPFLLYANPEWLAYVLEPLLEYQAAGLYPHKWSMHDLGSHFPNATGHPDGQDEPMPVEESGNMLIMALAYVNSLIADNSDAGKQAAKAWLTKPNRYSLFKQWTSFLITDGLIPANQLSTDDFAGRLSNQTNLSVKAILGILSMSQLTTHSSSTDDDDASYYYNIASMFLPEWLSLSLSRDGTHTKLSYDWFGSWGTLYNLYADALLCFNFFPSSLYKTQSSWYTTVMQRYGLPLDSRHLYTKSDWALWAAAVASEETEGEIVERLGRWVNETATDRAATDLYDSESGAWPGINFMARPVVGGWFAGVALQGRCGGRRRHMWENEKGEEVGTVSRAEGTVSKAEGSAKGRYRQWKLKLNMERGGDGGDGGGEGIVEVGVEVVGAKR